MNENLLATREWAVTLLDIGSLICNLVVAPAALYVAWDVQRRTTRHILKVVDASTSLHDTSVPQRRCYYEFQVYFRNIGLSLPEMSVSISFYDPKSHGHISCPLRWVNIRTGQSEKDAQSVASGQVVKFAWRTYEMSEAETGLLSLLVNLRKQHASLNIFCSGYLVKSIPLGSAQRYARYWLDRAIWYIYKALRLGSVYGRGGWLRRRFPDPKIDRLIWPLSGFVHYMREPKWRERLHEMTINQSGLAGSRSNS